MFKKRVFVILFLIFSVSIVWGQTTYTQDFDSSWGTSGYDTYAITGSQGENWIVDQGLREGSNVYEGSYSCRLDDGGTQYLTSPSIDGIGNVTFYYRHWDGSPSLDFSVEKSNDGNTWTEISSFSSFSNTSYQEFNQDVNDENAHYVRVKSDGSERLIIDSFSITSYAGSIDPEPSNHATDFTATANGYDQVDLSWTDATGTTLPDGYLIKANETGTFTVPADGTDPTEDTDLSDGSALVKVAHGAKGSYGFTSLTELTTYYFKIWPYTNTGTDIDFKTDGTVPTADATTEETPADPSAGDLIISEVCGDGVDGNSSNDNGYVEVYNNSGSTVLLDNIQVRYYNSNPGGPSSTFYLSGSIAAGEYIVITQDNTGFNSQYGFDADFEAGGNFYFNGGDDGVDIYLTTSKAEVLDEFNDNGADGTPFNWDDFKDYERTSTSVGNTLDSWTSNDGTGTPGAENDQTLPVTLSTFTVVFANEQPLLQWKTQSEESNAGWNIYRGATEAAFTNEAAEIINFEIIPGAGTSSEPTSYQFSDVFPVQPEASYYYWLESVSYSGATELYGPVTLEVPEDDIQGDTPDLPYKYGIQNYPNPFNPSTEISFVLPKASPVELNIYNLKGQKIRTLISGETLGKDKLHTVVWDGKDSNGQPASSGIYLYKLLTQDKVYSKKMLLVK